MLADAPPPAFGPNARSATPPATWPDCRSNGDLEMTITRIGVGPRMSQAVVHGSTVHLAGRVAQDRRTSRWKPRRAKFSRRSTPCLRRPDRTRPKILSATIYLVDMANFRNEQGLGRLGPAGPHAGPRDRRSKARGASLQGRDRGDRSQVIYSTRDAARPFNGLSSSHP